MNRIHLHRQREPWMTGMAAVLGLAVIAALVAWLWRPSKLVQAVPPERRRARWPLQAVGLGCRPVTRPSSLP